MIFEGTKSVELRRVRPKVAQGDHVLVYVSSPTKALLGKFAVAQVIAAEPDVLWELVRDVAGVSREHFDAYYEGAETAYAISLSEPSPLPNPVGLETLRSLWHRFQPPQCYAYLTQDQLLCVEPLM